MPVLVTKHRLMRGIKNGKVRELKVTGSFFDLKSSAQRENLMNTVSSAFDGKLNILVSSFKSE